ncbi:predicted protein [Chaetomium globosum CBS 148.51]|uniref:Uncharacterized protein n=1 Tax=Chaetomium globosum (strain ATCC 6205 / CBS 148.51 / DSM 1962 / NBRC 6347 / NRRL 1970) TaxID=306901 RepID=Q2HHD1_CHAGB|nr:uncharacterized protein CHGG_00373 [Chaetomium globosum CBS 148.51]EAQ92138.1 predicted protein [Chaetomium globosum CBS 148.51]
MDPKSALSLGRIEHTDCPKFPEDEDLEYMKEKGTILLQVIEVAGYKLEHVASVFTKAEHKLLKGERQIAVDFVRAVYFWRHNLIQETLEFYGKLSTYSNLLSKTEKTINNLDTCLKELEEAIKENEWSADLASFVSPTSVPTACPYQLFVETYLAREDIVADLREWDDDDDAGIIEEMANRLRKLLLNSNSPDLGKVGGGQPQVAAIAVHRDGNGDKSFVVGCSGPEWRGFPPVVRMVKRLRKRRLENYHSCGTDAFNALWKLVKDKGGAKPYDPTKTGSDQPKESEEARNKRREPIRQALKEMEEHESFLGKRGEVCIAFDTATWERKPACLVCYGTLGDQDPLGRTEAAKLESMDYFLGHV